MVAGHHDSVQKAAEPLLAMLDQRIAAKKQLDTLAGLDDALGKSLGAVELCARVLECVGRGQYYAALRLVERIRKARAPLLALPPLCSVRPTRLLLRAPGADARILLLLHFGRYRRKTLRARDQKSKHVLEMCETHFALHRLCRGHPYPPAQVALPVVPIGVVKEYISSQLPLAEDLIDQRARGVFSEWLVAARKASPRIGRRAIAAAWAQHLESEARWQQQLSAVRAVVAGVEPSASALGGFVLRPLEEAGDDPSAAAVGTSGGGGGLSADVLDGFELTAVYTASHVYETLGKGHAFWSYYCEERGKQLSIALAAKDAGGASFMSHYQEYFSQARQRPSTQLSGVRSCSHLVRPLRSCLHARCAGCGLFRCGGPSREHNGQDPPPPGAPRAVPRSPVESDGAGCPSHCLCLACVRLPTRCSAETFLD